MELNDFVGKFFNEGQEAYSDFITTELKKSNFKLYRYVPIINLMNKDVLSDGEMLSNLLNEKQFGFSSILNGYIYHNTPRFFNDPYDCVFGIGLNSFFREVLNQFIQVKDIGAIFDELENSEHQITSLDEMKDIISKLNIHQSLKDFVLFIFDSAFGLMPAIKEKGLINTQKEFTKKLLGNPEMFANLLQPFLQQKIDVSKLGETMNQLNIDLDHNLVELYELNPKKPQLEQFGNLSKAHGFTKEFDLLETNVNDGINNFNDKIFNLIDEKFGVASLTSSNNNPSMWSHYADKHKGLCIEYDFSSIIENTNLISMFLYPVNYQSVRITLDENILDKVDLKDIEKQGKGDLINLFLQGLYTKHESWKYESEWRSIALLKMDNEDARKIKVPKISAIYLGNKMGTQMKNRISKILNSNENTRSIELKQMINDISTYSLVAKDFK